MKAVNDALRILLTPSCWLRNYKTCPHMSRFINAALDRGEVPTQPDPYRIELAGKNFWGENYPYAYGHVGNLMPDRTTVFRLADAVAFYRWFDGWKAEVEQEAAK